MQKVPKIYKILIGIVLVSIIAGILKPDIPKALYNKIMHGYEVQDDLLKKDIESLEKKIENDSIMYENKLRELNDVYSIRLKIANEKYNWLDKEYKRNAKELDDYRNSSFDGKFELFSDAVIGKDTIQR